MEIMSIMTAPITEGGKWLIGVLKRQVSYLTNYKNNLNNLQSEASDLQIKRNHILQMVEEARKRLEEPCEEVVSWLKKINSIEAIVDDLNQEAKVNGRCFNGHCSDLGSRLQLSKRVVKTLREVKCLQQNGDFSKVSHERPPPSVEAVQSDWVEGFISRDMIMNEVMDAICDEGIRSIGVYGMGGSGKTTLMRSLNNKLFESVLFNKVIVVTVGHNPELNKIQDTIASRLGLEFNPHDSELTRSNKLFDCLKVVERVLLILDDLWRELDVSKLGFPRYDDPKGCKIIITTRAYDVCIKMNIQTRVEMKLLTETESWHLFQVKARDVVNLPSVKPIAMEIVQRCKGSPLALAALGSSLSEVLSIGRWRRALRVLKNPYPGGVEGVLEEVAASLRCSYDSLPGPEVKLCFLFCCLFPENYNIDLFDLRNYGMAEGFLNVDGSLEDASDELAEYTEKLKHCCLLLDGDEEGCVKMHDIVRDVAIWIASEDGNGFLVNIGQGLRTWSDIEKLKAYKRVSVMQYMNTVLSVPPECQQLQLRSLLLRENKFLTLTQENFFERMNTLLVLDMRYFVNCIATLASLSHLTSLKCLYLVGCDLSSSVYVLGEMMHLEILCLRDSKIKELPEQTGNLAKLRSLDLTSVELSSVAPNAIRKLSNLEELLAWNDYEDWDDEVASLVNLSRLEVRLRVEKFSVGYFPWKNLKYFRLAIDFPDPERQHIRYKNTLYLGRANPMTHWVTEPLSFMTQRLFLDSCFLFDNIFDLYVKGGFKHLEYLEIEHLFGNENLISLEEESEISIRDAFKYLKESSIKELGSWNLPNMSSLGFWNLPDPNTGILSGVKKLELSFLPEVKSSFKETLQIGILQNHQDLTMMECNGIEYLLSTASIAQGLHNLEVLVVRGCDGMENLVVSKEQEEDGASSSRQTMSRQTSIVNSPLTASPTFQNLRSLEIWDGKRLKMILSFSLALGLRRLTHLVINDCSHLQWIIGKEDDNEEEAAQVHSQALLPELKYLQLMNLPRLTSIYEGNLPLYSPNLNEISVYECPNLRVDWMMLGERLYPLVEQLEHDIALEVTHILSEMDQAEVLHLLESPEDLKAKVTEIRDDLRNFEQERQTMLGERHTMLGESLCALLDQVDINLRERVNAKLLNMNETEFLQLLESEDPFEALKARAMEPDMSQNKAQGERLYYGR